MRYTITVDDEALGVMLQALDMYSRTGMGQLEVSVEEFLRMNFYDRYYEAPDTVGDRGEAVRSMIYRIKQLVFGHPPHGSWGIRNPEVPRPCRQAYDMQRILRHARYRALPADRRGDARYTVDAEPPDLLFVSDGVAVTCEPIVLREAP